MIAANMCPIDVEYNVVELPEQGTRQLKTIFPGHDAYGLTCCRTGTLIAAECNPGDDGGVIMERTRSSQQGGMRIVQFDRYGAEIMHAAREEFDQTTPIPNGGSATRLIYNGAGNTCIITYTHRSR